MSPPFADIDMIIGDRETKIIICCGSGGVGKTTTSAALAVRAAEAGRKTVVLTIDPARRLAQSLGLGALDNTPRPVPEINTEAGGSLHAMMLDMKRTFDDVVIAHSTPDKAAAILANPFYQALSSNFSGTQEYMAMEKLGQLHAETNGHWDLIVVDTPPARSALDFLDAPEHLSALLDGRFLRMLLTPARGPLRLMSVGFNLVSSAMTKILGARDHLRRADLRHRVRGPVRRLPATRDVDLRAALVATDHVPGSGDPAARRPARGRVLRGSAHRGADAAVRHGDQPGAQHNPRHLRRARSGARRGPRRRRTSVGGRGVTHGMPA